MTKNFSRTGRIVQDPEDNQGLTGQILPSSPLSVSGVTLSARVTDTLSFSLKSFKLRE